MYTIPKGNRVRIHGTQPGKKEKSGHLGPHPEESKGRNPLFLGIFGQKKGR